MSDVFEGVSGLKPLGDKKDHYNFLLLPAEHFKKYEQFAKYRLIDCSKLYLSGGVEGIRMQYSDKKVRFFGSTWEICEEYGVDRAEWVEEPKKARAKKGDGDETL